MENIKKDLWEMKRDSLHVKFFQWMWGIYAPDTYKTACPYYWQFAGSMVILPLIIIAKILNWLLMPFINKVKITFESNSKKKINDLVLRATLATTDEELYKIYKSKCFTNHSEYSEFNDVYSKIVDGYHRHKKVLKKSKDLRQAKMDAFKYGPIGSILMYVIGFIFLILIAWAVYLILHLFSWPEFAKASIGIIIILSIASVIIFIVAIGLNLYDKYVCDSWVGTLRPLKWIAWPFKTLWTGVLMFVDMVKAIYTKSCPTIDWK